MTHPGGGGVVRGGGGASPTWNQSQWEDWILALLDDTVKEIDLDEWCRYDDILNALSNCSLFSAANVFANGGVWIQIIIKML